MSLFEVEYNEQVVEECKTLCAVYLGGSWMDLSPEEFDCKPVQ